MLRSCSVVAGSVISSGTDIPNMPRCQLGGDIPEYSTTRPVLRSGCGSGASFD